MDITRAAIEKNRVTVLGLVVVVAAGWGAFGQIPRAEDPGFTVRTALILTYFPGASPERVELLVTDKLEKVIQEMPELDFLRSESKTGVSILYVNVQETYTEMRPIWDDLRRKVDRAAGDLPEGVVGPIVNDEFGDVFGIILTLTGEGYSYRELKEVADQAREEFLTLDQVAKVDIVGAQEERIFVEYNNARLADLGLTPSGLGNLLEAQNIIIPGGSVTAGPERIALEPTGSFEEVDELRRTLVTVPGRNELVPLEDVALVERGYVDPPGSLVRAGGHPGLALGISLVDGGNVELLGAQVRGVLEELRAAYPIGLELEVLAFQPDVVSRKVDDFVGNLLQAIGLVVLVMLMTLGLRTGLLVAALIPMTMIATIFLMDALGIGLDQVSLAALIIALGMLVDNAIVMSESIMVSLEEGKGRMEAAVESARELRVPLLISSLTTAAAFLPIALAESTTGEYTRSIFSVVTIALLSSWVLALTMTPLLCYHFLRVEKRKGEDSSADAFDTALYRGYRSLLVPALRWRWASAGATVLVFLGVMQLFRFIPNIFFPPSDRPIVMGDLFLPVGTSIEETVRVTEAFDAFVRDSLQASEDRGGVTGWAAFVGRGAPKFRLAYDPEAASPEYAFLFLNTSSAEARREVVDGLTRFAETRFPDLRGTFLEPAEGPPVQAPVQVRVSGRETGRLFEIVDEVKGRLASIPGTRAISDDWGPQAKKLVVDVNEPRARLAGVTNRDIAVSLQSSLSGVQTTQFREGDEVIPVVLRSVAADRQDLGKLESLNVLSQLTGRAVPLKQVADVRLAWEPARIIRRDRFRTVTVSAELDEGVTATEVNGVLVPLLDADREGWGRGFSYELGGEVEASQKANASIAAKLPVAFFLIVLLLVLQFNSFRRPVIILLTIPLGLIGVILGLLVTGSYFGFMTLLGVISLAGIVINNAIVLLDRIRIEEEGGLAPPDAVVTAAQRRLRPILLTTATTVGGLIPLWLGGGLMWEPMAIAIIFGLLFATLLTLGVVPVLYSILFGVRYRGWRWSPA